MHRATFFNAIRAPLFAGRLSQSQVQGIEELLDAWEKHGSGDRRHLAYILGGVHHETGRRMVPVREGFATTDAGARQAVNNLARRRGPNSAVAKYAKPAGSFGHVYYGRGRIQNTWLDNYRKLEKRFGVPLVKYPDRIIEDGALDAAITVIGHLEGIWTGRKLEDYITEGKTDYREARRIVNILDKADLIAGYANRYEQAIRSAEVAEQAAEKIEPMPTVEIATPSLPCPPHESKPCPAPEPMAESEDEELESRPGCFGAFMPRNP